MFVQNLFVSPIILGAALPTLPGPFPFCLSPVKSCRITRLSNRKGC
jgi:hypothetical protein